MTTMKKISPVKLICGEVIVNSTGLRDLTSERPADSKPQPEGFFMVCIRFLTDCRSPDRSPPHDEISVVAFAQIRIHIVVFQSDGQHSVDVRRDIEIVGEIIGGSRRKQS